MPIACVQSGERRALVCTALAHDLHQAYTQTWSAIARSRSAGLRARVLTADACTASANELAPRTHWSCRSRSLGGRGAARPSPAPAPQGTTASAEARLPASARATVAPIPVPHHAHFTPPTPTIIKPLQTQIAQTPRRAHHSAALPTPTGIHIPRQPRPRPADTGRARARPERTTRDSARKARSGGARRYAANGWRERSSAAMPSALRSSVTSTPPRSARQPVGRGRRRSGLRDPAARGSSSPRTVCTGPVAAPARGVTRRTSRRAAGAAGTARAAHRACRACSP